MKINPVYKKELKISVRTIKMSMIILGYNLLLAVIGLFSFYLTFEEAARYGMVDYSNMLTIYTTIGVIEIALVLFIIPAFTSGSVAGERERQTLDILLTTKMRPIEVIFGKLASSISSLLLLVISSLPLLAIVFAVGGIRFIDLLQLIFLAAVTAVFVGSIGIFFSTVCKRTVPATILTYGTVILLIAGTAGIIWGAYLVISMSGGTQYDANGNYMSPDVGNLLLILLVNPIITMISMITEQFGSPSEFATSLNNFGTASTFIVEHWFMISVVIQLAFALLFILLSAFRINPLRRQKRKRRS